MCNCHYYGSIFCFDCADTPLCTHNNNLKTTQQKQQFGHSVPYAPRNNEELNNNNNNKNNKNGNNNNKNHGVVWSRLAGGG